MKNSIFLSPSFNHLILYLCIQYFSSLFHTLLNSCIHSFIFLQLSSVTSSSYSFTIFCIISSITLLLFGNAFLLHLISILLHFFNFCTSLKPFDHLNCVSHPSFIIYPHSSLSIQIISNLNYLGLFISL